MIPERPAGFALALHRALSPAAATDSVCSPWSVSAALGLLAGGADEPARREIETALGAAPGTVGTLAEDVAAVAAARAEGSWLQVASSLWVDDRSTPLPDFTAALRRWPGAALHRTSLARNPEAARSAVNADVARTTCGLVPEILPPGAIGPGERAVVVSALYLLAAWQEPFAAAETRPEPFHAPSGTRAVPTMRGAREVPYAAVTGGWRYAALPLALGLSAEVLLPQRRGVPDPGRPEPAALAELRAGARPHRVDLHLPRFRLAGGGPVSDALRALGVRRLFDPTAKPLPGVVAGEALHVSGAFHRAVLRVDEHGIEGAAATAAMARAVSFRALPEVEMRVDRPFHLLVTSRRTGSVLFAARVAEP